MSLKQFMDATTGELKEAADVVTGILGQLPDKKSLREFFRDYPAMRMRAISRARIELAKTTLGLEASGVVL